MSRKTHINFFRNFSFSPEKDFYKKIWQVLHYKPRNGNLFRLAFTHKSAARSVYKKRSVNNERLEYLGDSILNAVVADYLYHQFPNKEEGFLTKMRAKIVSRDTLNTVADELKLNLLINSKVSSIPHTNILGNALEAIIGAIFLERGYIFTKKYIINNILKPYISLEKYQNLIFDFKSHLIEWCQKNDMEVVFEDVERENSDSNNPSFISKVRIFDNILGKGEGTSKKEAQQEAARQAYHIYIES